uniref:MIP20244p1 n=1 Tax=Drosophila melanogaster TaxID=7227 RepID=G4LTZ6_DROME|nr:MIP20244p1 [Drosophila melanogaster]
MAMEMEMLSRIVVMKAGLQSRDVSICTEEL